MIRKNKVFIGDNLHIMKTICANYKDTINFIYIDPPYNTESKKFVFNDNNDSWCVDIQNRLVEAKKMLACTGCIFISIDDNELANLLNICYEVFGKKNFVGVFITKQAQRSNAKHINVVHEYIVCFAKCKKDMPSFFIKRIENPSESQAIITIIKKVKKAYHISKDKGYNVLKKCIDNYCKETNTTWIRNYNNIDKNGDIFFSKDLSTPGKPSRLDIDEIDIHLAPLKTRGWSSKEKILDLYKNNRLCFKNNRPYSIEYLYEATNNVSSILDFYSRQGTNDLKKLDLDGIFDTPKPVEMIKFLIRCSQHKNAVIMDFYAGSGTTAQAVYEINKEDGTKHKFILIQLDEEINKYNESYRLLTERGYKNPVVSDALLLRIDTFLKKNMLNDNYEVVKF